MINGMISILICKLIVRCVGTVHIHNKIKKHSDVVKRRKPAKKYNFTLNQEVF